MAFKLLPGHRNCFQVLDRRDSLPLETLKLSFLHFDTLTFLMKYVKGRGKGEKNSDFLWVEVTENNNSWRGKQY